MELRGFDSYDVLLGDEMRGERASMGKSLRDAERDMRLKARLIQAIEDCDLAAFPNPSVVAGYVRSYARYLGMDAEACYERFCRESGFQSPSAMVGLPGRPEASGGPSRAPLNSGAGAELARSRFAAPPVQSRIVSRISLSALSSSLALLALMAGLSYGGYALLKDIQRVGFAPLPSAPTVVADAPVITAPAVEAEEASRPSQSDYEGGGILAAMAAPIELPPIAMPRRDGPISAIDPETAGVFAPTKPVIRSADDAIQHLAPPSAEAALDETPGTPEIAAKAVGDPGIALHASEDAWIRVREGEKTVLFEGILGAGQRFELPERVAAPVLKAGNAGGIYVLIDGIAYGPVGQRGHVARNISLLADDVRTDLPQAEDAVLEETDPGDTHRRAEAAVQ